MEARRRDRRRPRGLRREALLESATNTEPLVGPCPRARRLPRVREVASSAWCESLSELSQSFLMSTATDNPKGWYSRGYLPHLDAPSLLQVVTFRLADSLPRHILERMYADLEPDDPERLRRIERYLDAGNGASWLNRSEVAEIVEATLLHGDGKQYRMIGWVIMPSHVHLLVETVTGVPFPRLAQAWKSVLARRINRLLERAGAVWARDYFDRYIRDESHLLAVIRYIDNNPVQAGLVGRPEEWPHCSARFRTRMTASGTADAPVGPGTKRR